MRWIVSGLLLILLFRPGLYAQEKLSLEDCQRLALERNEKLKIAQEKSGAATALRKAAFTQYLPNFSANGSYIRTNKSLSLFSEDKFLPVIPFNAIDAQSGSINQQAFYDPAVAPTFLVFDAQGSPVLDQEGNPVFKQYVYLPQEEGKLGSKNVFVGQIGFIQPIFAGFKIRETNRIAGFAERVAEQNQVFETSELLHKVEKSFWQLISLEERQKLAVAYLDLLDNLSADIQNLYDEGFVTKNDLLKVDVKKNDAQLKLFKVNQGIKLSKMALNQLIGLDVDNQIELTPSEADSLVIRSQQQLYASAREKRPELLMLEQQINIARSATNIMKSRYMPDLIASVNYMVSNPNPYNGFEEEFGGDFNAGVVLHVPLFHWGDKNHTLRAARHEERIAELELKEASEMIRLEVAQAFFAWQESLERVKLTQNSLAQAEENLKVNQDNYTEGLINTSDLLEAQTLWQQAASELISARSEQWICVSRLKKVDGSLGLAFSQDTTDMGSDESTEKVY